MTLDTQFITMFSMVLGGLYVGFANETYRRVSVRWKNRTILVYLFEIVFWIIQTSVLFYLLYQVNDGEIRIYIFLACLLGFSLYIVLFQAIYRRILEIIIRIVKNVTNSIIRIVEILVIEPIKWSLSLIVTILMFLIYLVLTILSIVLKVILLPIRLSGRLLANILPKNFFKKFAKFHSFYSTIEYKLKNWIKAVVLKRR